MKIGNLLGYEKYNDQGIISRKIMKNFTIIIPIFNEIDSVFDLIKGIEEEFGNSMLEVIIVNDGSTDKFKEN